MPAAEGERYVRVYRTILTDEKFVDVRADRACLGTWLLLLLDADALWPAPASVPRWASDEHVALLSKVELIVLEPGDRFRVKGLDAERSAQRAKAKGAADARWNAPSNAPSNAQADAKTMPPNPTKPNQDSTVLIGSPTPPARAREAGARRRTKVTGFTSPLETTR
jgi:hypothetical protein